jgi:hypothetical protein
VPARDGRFGRPIAAIDVGRCEPHIKGRDAHFIEDRLGGTAPVTVSDRPGGEICDGEFQDR